MAYHVVFDVADRIPDIGLGVVGALVLVAIGLTALRDIDAVLDRWPLVLLAGVAVASLEGVVDRDPTRMLGPLFLAVMAVVGERLARQHHAREDEDQRLVILEQVARAESRAELGAAPTSGPTPDRERTPPVRRPRRALPPGGPGTGLGGILLLVATIFGLAMAPAVGLRDQLARGGATVIEGSVDIYFELAFKGECITVADRDFCYSDSITPGFNHTRALGGPMRDGLQVRLSLVGNVIVRVEVADEL